ncbi:hypothetical protein DHEL01_v208027 [Diaporthe helianthi]|uniref:Glycoside hydrolase n=1 Tax=Diaporthe helianthi TaxID=158607 RepID=A0A2P5HTL1_DIAHE|nr:hypothetical protein DHEL01_v208027 [Diaporthe helianthi]
MPGINQLPPGSEVAAAVSLMWASFSWICSSLLLWLTWSHHEGWSYLSLLAVSSISSTTFSIIQQIRDVTFYVDIVTEAFEHKLRLPPDDPELAIANGSVGVDLVLYYLQYYLYNVQAMLVIFWAAELCQLTYQVGERRAVRLMFRRLHTAGKSISWLLPLTTILMLQIPSLRESFVVFILIADLPLMLSLAIGSGLMIAVLIRYVRTRQKFTQWSPPNWNSGSTSQGGTEPTLAGSQDSSHRKPSGRRGLYDRWLMVRFTIAFIALAIFECTNTLFQVTALRNNMKDSKASAPDLSTGREIQAMILFMPGTTPGIFIFLVFGTTTSSRKKLANLLIPRNWRESSTCCFGRRKSQTRPSTPELLTSGERGITVKHSLTVTSSSRLRPRPAHEDDFPRHSIISLDDLTRRQDSTQSVHISSMKPLPLTPGSPPTSRFNTPIKEISSSGGTTSIVRELNSCEEKDGVRGGSLTRTNTDDSFRVPNMQVLGTEHSDDSGPILPIQGHDVRHSRDVSTREGIQKVDKKSLSFLRPKR